jgi:hypothetical protein
MDTARCFETWSYRLEPLYKWLRARGGGLGLYAFLGVFLGHMVFFSFFDPRAVNTQRLAVRVVWADSHSNV